MKYKTDHVSLNQIDLNLLHVFHMLMEERSVTRAAMRAGRSQSAVSHSLNKLRAIFKDELFYREGRRMEPTPRSIELAATISGALGDIQDAIDRHWHFDAAQTHRNFRIGLLDYTGALYLPLLIDEFSRRAPHASLNIIHAREQDILNMFKGGELECAIVGNPNTRPGDFSEQLLAIDRMVCACWSGSYQGSPPDLEAYLAAPHLQISTDGMSRGLTDEALVRLGYTRRVVATIPHYLAAPWVIKGTPIITAFGDGMLQMLYPETETMIFKPPVRLPDINIKLLYLPHLDDDLGHAWLRALIGHVAEQLSRQKEDAYRKLGLSME